MQPSDSIASIHEAGKAAMERFQVALSAIIKARDEGRISPLIAAERIAYLAGRYDALFDPRAQIAAADAMIRACEDSGRS